MKNEKYRLVAIFADAKEHSCFEIINFGSILLKKSQKQVEKVFKRLLEYGWVQRSWKSSLFYTDWFRLTSKGDDAFRSFKIDLGNRGRLGDDFYKHYKYFDRESKDGKMGVKLKDNVTEKKMNEDFFTPTFGKEK